MVYSGTMGGTILMWNTAQKKGEIIRIFKSLIVAGKLSGHLSHCSALIRNARYLVSGSLDTNVKVWDPRAKNCVVTFKGHNEQITCLDISPDSSTIVSGSMDGTLKLWDIRT
jgi:WD40 repeat protein